MIQTFFKKDAYLTLIVKLTSGPQQNKNTNEHSTKQHTKVVIIIYTTSHNKVVLSIYTT